MTDFKRLNQNANVSIYMKGLGIAHHNTGKWEFLFIRKIKKHNLKIVVKEFRQGLDDPIQTVYPIPVNAANIEIKTTSSVPIATGGFHYKPSGNNFRAWRGVDHDLESRWIIDLSAELHLKPVRLTKKNYLASHDVATSDVGSPVALTYLSVSDAVFYTATLSKRPYSITFRQKQGDPENYRFSRVVGQWIGFDIEWQAGVGQTEIKFNSNLISDIILTRKPNVIRYEIEVNNDCCAGEIGRQSDFHYYYELLVDMPEEIFNEDVSLPINESNFLTTSTTVESNATLSNKEAFIEFLGSLLGGKEDDCHFVQISQLNGITSLEDLL